MKSGSLPTAKQLKNMRNKQITTNYLAGLGDPNKDQVNQKTFCRKYNISDNTLRKNINI